jgi:proteasome lid subunit RPN8/RPN11
MSQDLEETKTFDMVKMEQKEQEILATINTVPFGPCSIDVQAWKRLKLLIKAHSTGENAREVCLALLGKYEGKRLVIKDFVQLLGKSSKSYCIYSLNDVKKIEKHASKENLILVGLCHTHCQDSVAPSVTDRTEWISSMLEFNRPLLYYIIAPNTLRVAAYTIPPQIFYQLKEAIKFVRFEAKE